MDNMKKTITPAFIAAALMLTGCSDAVTYDELEVPVQQVQPLNAVSDTYVDTPKVYENDGIPDNCIGTFVSDNGACTIRQMEHYYDVTVDRESFSPAEAGKGYANAIIKAFPDFYTVTEPYLYENIIMGFPNILDDYSAVEERINTLAKTLRPDQQEELSAFAEELSGGLHGFAEDGNISFEEALAFNLIPDALRGTACSALSLWGDKTVSGDMLSVRFLDWNLGSDYQMCRLHAVIHMKNKERSYTGISFLGFGGIVSAINDDGVFAAILDAQSGEDYDCTDKLCYTWELRYALEEFDSAKDLGQFMVDNSKRFTISHLIYTSDANGAYCAEDADAALQEKGKGFSVLRDKDSPLHDCMKWDSPDSMCIVNTFHAKGNLEAFRSTNIIRFNKYNTWVSSHDKFDPALLKTVLTCEQVKQGMKKGEAQVMNVRNQGTSQIIITDYSTGRVQVAFTPADGLTDDVVFTDIGHY